MILNWKSNVYQIFEIDQIKFQTIFAFRCMQIFEAGFLWKWFFQFQLFNSPYSCQSIAYPCLKTSLLSQNILQGEFFRWYRPEKFQVWNWSCPIEKNTFLVGTLLSLVILVFCSLLGRTSEKIHPVVKRNRISFWKEKYFVILFINNNNNNKLEFQAPGLFL